MQRWNIVIIIIIIIIIVIIIIITNISIASYPEALTKGTSQ